MSNFPSFDPPSHQNNGADEYKVTGHAGTGVEEDEERARFEQSFPDIGGEASAIEVGDRLGFRVLGLRVEAGLIWFEMKRVR